MDRRRRLDNTAPNPAARRRRRLPRVADVDGAGERDRDAACRGPAAGSTASGRARRRRTPTGRIDRSGSDASVSRGCRDHSLGRSSRGGARRGRTASVLVACSCGRRRSMWRCPLLARQTSLSDRRLGATVPAMALQQPNRGRRGRSHACFSPSPSIRIKTDSSYSPAVIHADRGQSSRFQHLDSASGGVDPCRTTA